MLYKEYGQTGKKVSILGFGGMRFESIDDRETCAALLVEAARAGVNYFDTAPAYFGIKSEEAFGLGFKELKRLGLPFYCATKTGKSVEKEIREEIEQQLKRLGLDAIDFYHIWCVTSLENWEQRKKNGVLKTFQKLKEEGLIRHICVSTHLLGDDTDELLREGIIEGVLLGYSAYNFSFRQAALKAIAKRKLGCVVMNPLGGGVIPRTRKLFDFIRHSERRIGRRSATAVSSSRTMKSRRPAGRGQSPHLHDALKAVEGYREIPALEIERIKGGISDAFQDLCTGCQYCESCPEGIPVSKFMGAYNMKQLYGKDQGVLDMLKWHWNLPPEEAEKCIGCGQCEDLCTQHLSIVKRLEENRPCGGGQSGEVMIIEIGRNPKPDPNSSKRIDCMQGPLRSGIFP